MNVFRQISDWFFGKRLSDPFFGELEFDQERFLTPPGRPQSRKRFQYWNGRIRFNPVDREVGISLPGDATGPTEHQRSILRELSSRWSTLTEPLTDAIHPVYHEWFQNIQNIELFDPVKTFDSLELAGFQIEHPTLYPNRIEFQDFQIHFLVPFDDTGHDLVVHIKNWSVVRASFE